MRANEFLTELWTQPYPLESRAIGPADREYLFTTSDDRRGRIVFDSALDTDQGGPHILFVVVHFYIDNEFHDTGRGDAIKIFSTVVTACRDYMKKFNPPVVVLESESRKKRSLYIKMANEFPNYVIYTDWAKDRELGQEIDNASVNGIRDEMLVLRRKDFDPKKTRVYVEDELRLYEFAPDGFEQFSLYVGDGVRRHFVERFASVEAAQDEVEFIWDTDPETRLFVWMVTDSNDEVRWYYDPQELADQPRTRFRPPKN
jgi:hypothetical protein